MDELTIALAKLSGLHRTVLSRMTERNRHGDLNLVFDPPTVREYFQHYKKLSDQVKSLLPQLFSDLPKREIPKPTKSDVFDGRGYIPVALLSTLVRDIEYILTVNERNQAATVEIPAMTVTREGVFFAGQYFDAIQRVKDILAQAKHSIVIIDGYINDDVLNLLSAKSKGVAVNILTKQVSAALKIAAGAFNKQYGSLSIRTSSAFHDRFVITDDTDFYHFGASIKDLGNRGFMFSLIEEPTVIAALKGQWNQEWAGALVVV
jgi:hypothetical protein